MRSRQGESGARMIERRIQPRGRVVALLAGLREVRGYVIRIRRALVVLQVARHAGRIRDAVIIVHVAVGTLPRRHRVHAGKGEG